MEYEASPVAGSLVIRNTRRLLEVPLFYKILSANAAIVLAVASGAALLGARGLSGAPEDGMLRLGVGLAALGMLLTVAVNALIVRTALRPLHLLQEAAARVQAGDLDARADVSPLADRDLMRLTATFNGMLESQTEFRLRLREAAARALAAAEAERKRISLELHDGTAQTLAALLLRIRLARRATAESTREELLSSVAHDITQAMDELRSIAMGLRPPALDMLGLLPAIESHIRGLQGSTDLEIDLVERVDGVRLTPETELALYRIIQEALSNVVRHAKARRVSVRIECERTELRTVIEDDGIGFSTDQVLSGGRGLGLFGMRERALYVGGTVDLRSAPGAGTAVEIRVPGACASLARPPRVAARAG